jgi:prepilin-type N-terminal cleavage/methylation domain-containing protein
MHSRPAQLRRIAPRRSPGFTLIEAIVVIVIVGLLAGITVPRMINVGQRQAELEAKGVRSLLSVAADKASSLHRPVAIDFAEATTGSAAVGPRLTIWVEQEDVKAAADASGAARVKWERDRLAEIVELSRLKIASVTSDGAVLPKGKWRITITPGQPRPAMELRLEPVSSGDGPVWMVTLAPDDTAAVLVPEDGFHTAGAASAPFRTIDLDDTGKGDSKW